MKRALKGAEDGWTEGFPRVLTVSEALNVG